MSEPVITIGLAVAALAQLFFVFLFVRFVLRFFLARLTAHYVAIGVVLSFFFGLVLLAVSNHLGLIAAPNGKSDALTAVGFCVLISLNLFAMPLLYGWDKRMSMMNAEGQRRIPENAFHILVFSGGIVGSTISQIIFNHKVSKSSFLKKQRWVFITSAVLYGLIAYAALN